MLEVMSTLLGGEGDIDEYDSRFLKLFNLSPELLKKEEYSLLSDVFDKCKVGFWNIISELKIFLKEELRKNWKIVIDIDIFGENESSVQTTENIQTPIQKMMKISSMVFQEIINLTQRFLSNYQYHLSILNTAEKLADVLAQSSNNNKISIGEDWKNVIANPSYVIYYTDFVHLYPIHDAENFFQSFYRQHLNFKEFSAEQFKDLPRLFINDLKDKDEKFTRTIKYLLKRLPKNCKKEERRRAKETLSHFLACLTNLDGYHQAQFNSLFSWLVGKGRFAEIYSFRKLVEADLNVIPNLKIKTNDKVYELDALIPITKDTVIQCEYTLRGTVTNEKRKKFREVENFILNEMGLRCKTLVIGRECLRSSTSTSSAATDLDVTDLKILSFSDLNNKPKVISTILSLI